MTPQEIFDTSVIGVLNQNGRSIDENNVCYYRSPFDGKKCAAGHLIPDDLYEDTMEHKAFDMLVMGTRYKLPKYLKENVKLIRALQKVHDNSNEYIQSIDDDCTIINDLWRSLNNTPEHTMANMYRWSKVIANKFGLSTENIDKVWNARQQSNKEA